MKVILLDRMRNLGELGEQVVVKPGYARNYLLPQGKAVHANKDNIAYFESKRAELEKKAQERREGAADRSKALEGLTVMIEARAGEGGKLYGSVGTGEIAKAAKAMGFEIKRSEILLPNGPIREAGDCDVTVQLLGDEVATTIQVSIKGIE